MNEIKLQQTIMDLQARLAFQEDSIDSISLTVARQQSRIDLLQREILRLKEILEDVRATEGGSTDATDELPPHY